MALYEVARLRRDVLSNSAAALAALDAYEARFASGTLAPEVRIARVDLLSRLGRFDEALKVSEMLLASPVGSPRATELRLLRGNLLRDKKHDCAAALSEYQRIQSDPGPRGEQAEFAAAGCLERLGRATEAIETYEHYLGRARPGQAAQARQRLLKLTQ
jgi:tetratricopeptide (TPR) repeat protein